MSVMLRYASALVLFVFVAAQARGDNSTSHKVDITLSGPDCVRAPDVIQVVFAGRDREPFPAYRDKSKPCRWTGEKPGAPFRLTDSFSVRLGGARSDCRLPFELAGSPSDPEPVAQLSFSYSRTASQLNIVTEGPFYVSYEREFPADETLKGSRDCRDQAEFRRSETVSDVAFSDETLRLRFALKLGRPDSPWVTLDEPLQREILTNAKRHRPTILPPEAIGVAVVRQTAVERGRITPNTGNSVSANLKAKGMKNVTLREQ
jgi:hypothetical protein